MRVVLQRVSRASVTVDGALISEIGLGYLLLVGIGDGDTAEDLSKVASKIVNLRIFSDSDGKMNLALGDVGGQILVVSQFTLYGDIRKGRRPSWAGAAEPDAAAEKVEAFATALEDLGVEVGRGIFGADMKVELLNDGPVTLVIDSSQL